MGALPMAGSSEAVDMMKELLLAGDVTGSEVELWLLSLAFIQQPTAGMINSVKVLDSHVSLYSKQTQGSHLSLYSVQTLDSICRCTLYRHWTRICHCIL